MTLHTDGNRKVFYPVTRRKGSSRADMEAYWIGNHAALVAGTPGIQEGYRNYVQNHLTVAGPRGDPFPYDGVTQLALQKNRTPSVTSLDREKIKADERKVFDTTTSFGFSAIENVVIAGRAPLKLMIFSRRLPSISSQQYSDHWCGRHVEVILSQEDFRSHIRGYVQNHVVPGSARYLNGETVADADAFDGVIEMWFDSIDAATTAFGSHGYQVNVRADEPNFIYVGHSISHFVQEMVVFDGANV